MKNDPTFLVLGAVPDGRMYAMKMVMLEVGIEPKDLTYQPPFNNHWRSYRWNIILTVGHEALGSIWPDLSGNLKQLHGRPLFYKQKSIVWPTYFPVKTALPTIKEDLNNLVAYHRDGKDAWPEDCWLCGGELHDWDEKGRGLGRCRLHAQTQGVLFDEREPTA